MSKHKFVIDSIGRAKIYYLAREGQWVSNNWDPVLSVLGNHCTDTVLFQLPEEHTEHLVYVNVSSGCGGKTSVNRILLSETEEGYEWEITKGQIAYPGPIKLQLDVRGEANEEVWQSSIFSAIIGSVIDTSCLIDGQDASYLEELNRRIEKQTEETAKLLRQIRDSSNHLPYVGANGNWLIYDIVTMQYVDSEINIQASVTETDESVLEKLIDADILMAVSSGGNLLSDETGSILMW